MEETKLLLEAISKMSDGAVNAFAYWLAYKTFTAICLTGFGCWFVYNFRKFMDSVWSS